MEGTGKSIGVLYADRGFVSINGVELLDVESIEARVSDGTKVVPTMTRNRRNKGSVKGNRDITLTFAVAVQNRLGTPKLESLDYESNSVALTFEHGADRYTFTDLDFVDFSQSAGGVGSEGKKNFSMIAMDFLDKTGNSALFPTALSNAL